MQSEQSAFDDIKLERRIVVIAAMIQFINVLEFMIVMPLGPAFASSLNFDVTDAALVSSGYMASAIISGFFSLFFMDRFSRSKALLFSCIGLWLATTSVAFAYDFYSLLFTRFLAGLFGGPTSALMFALLSDHVSLSRRGRAMGVVLSSFSLASIFGVPLGLELSNIGTWRLSFHFVGALCFLVIICIYQFLVKKRIGFKAKTSGILLNQSISEIFGMLKRSSTRLSLMMTFFAMFSGFSIIPNIAGFLQYNLSFPQNRLGSLYFIGGIVSLLTMRVVGFLVDRFGSFLVGSFSAFILSFLLYFSFVQSAIQFSAWVIFVGFMFGMSMRNVAYNTLTSKVSPPEERGRFQSMQSIVQHIGSATGAGLSSYLLTQGANKNLLGMDKIGILAILSTLVVPWLMYKVQKVLPSNRIGS